MTTKTLNEITAQLWEFLHDIAESSELPLLDDIEVKRRHAWPDWRVKAYVGGIGSSVSAKDAIATIRAYARLQDAPVTVDEPYRSTVQPSGFQVAVRTCIVLGGIRVEVLALLDGAEVADVAQVHVLGEVAGVLMGGVSA